MAEAVDYTGRGGWLLTCTCKRLTVYSRLQALCWSTPSSWWSCFAATQLRAWTKWSTGWTLSAVCWSLLWHCAWWLMAPGSHSLESGAGWVPPSLSSTHILTFGSELSLAGGASCSDRKQLRRSTPCPEPQLSSCRSTMMCAPSAFRSVTLVAFVFRRWLKLRTNNIRYYKTSNPVLILIWLWKFIFKLV